MVSTRRWSISSRLLGSAVASEACLVEGAFPNTTPTTIRRPYDAFQIRGSASIAWSGDFAIYGRPGRQVSSDQNPKLLVSAVVDDCHEECRRRKVRDDPDSTGISSFVLMIAAALSCCAVSSASRSQPFAHVGEARKVLQVAGGLPRSAVEACPTRPFLLFVFLFVFDWRPRILCAFAHLVDVVVLRSSCEASWAGCQQVPKDQSRPNRGRPMPGNAACPKVYT